MGFRFWLILLAVWLGSPASRPPMDENPDEFFGELYREFGIIMARFYIA